LEKSDKNQGILKQTRNFENKQGTLKISDQKQGILKTSDKKQGILKTSD
jgi:hypothetical protein